MEKSKHTRRQRVKHAVERMSESRLIDLAGCADAKMLNRAHRLLVESGHPPGGDTVVDAALLALAFRAAESGLVSII